MDNFQTYFVDVTQDTYHDDIIRTIAQYGIATFEIATVDDLRKIAQGLGDVYIEEDTDQTGVKTVQNSAGGSVIHTDRSSQQSPPNLIMVWCEQQSGTGGESIFADGKLIYDDLRTNHPESLAALERSLCAYFGYPDYASAAAVFNRNPDESIYVKFRYDRWGYYSVEAIPHLPHLLDSIKRHQFQVRLENGQGYLCANRRFLHGALAGQGDENRTVYRMILDCDKVALGFEA